MMGGNQSWRTCHFLPMEAARLQTPQAGGCGGGGICEAGGDAVTADSRSFLFSAGFSYVFFIYTSSLFPSSMNDVDRPTLSRSWKPRSLVSLKQKARRPSQRAVWSGVAGINRRESTNVEDVGCNLALVAPGGPERTSCCLSRAVLKTSPHHKRMRAHGK